MFLTSPSVLCLNPFGLSHTNDGKCEYTNYYNYMFNCVSDFMAHQFAANPLAVSIFIAVEIECQAGRQAVVEVCVCVVINFPFWLKPQSVHDRHICMRRLLLLLLLLFLLNASVVLHKVQSNLYWIWLRFEYWV